MACQRANREAEKKAQARLMAAGALLYPVEAAGIEPTDKVMENPRQDTLLPAIALISRRFVVPPYPVLPRPVPFSPKR